MPGKNYRFLEFLPSLSDGAISEYLEDLLRVKKKIWVKLNNKFRAKLFSKALEKAKSLHQLAKLLRKELGVKGAYLTIYRWCKGRRPNGNNTKIISHGIPLHVLKFLSDFTKISMDEIEKHVDFIKGDGPAHKVYHPKFPIILNNATASVISHTLHDGILNEEMKRISLIYN